MSISDLQQLGQLVDKGGVSVVLLMAVVVVTVGSVRGWWYSGPAYRQLMQERDAWRQIALGLGQTAERSVHIAADQLGVPLGPPGSR